MQKVWPPCICWLEQFVRYKLAPCCFSVSLKFVYSVAVLHQMNTFWTHMTKAQLCHIFDVPKKCRIVVISCLSSKGIINKCMSWQQHLFWIDLRKNRFDTEITTRNAFWRILVQGGVNFMLSEVVQCVENAPRLIWSAVLYSSWV